MTRKIVIAISLVVVVFILWGAWPKSSVWYEIMNRETEAVRARIEAGFEANSTCPGVDTLTLREKWEYWSEFEWPPKEYRPNEYGKWDAVEFAVEEKHSGLVQFLVDNGAAWPSAMEFI